jgi:cell division transport system permease protein
MRASFVASGVWEGLRRNAGMTIALILNTAIALLFVGGGWMANKEITNFRKHYENKLSVSVYLCPQTTNTGSHCEHRVTAEETDQVRAALQADPMVVSITFVSEEQALQSAINLQGPKVGQFLKVGDLPASVSVKLKDQRNQLQVFEAKYTAMTGVDQVGNGQEQALNQLLDLISKGRWASVAIALVVLIASILLLGNTIRTAAAQRKAETGIMRLVGASRWMTELPFVIEALIATVVGGVVAIALLFVGKYFLFDNVFAQQIQRGVIPGLDSNDVLIAGGIGLIVGILLSAIAAFGTLRLYVRL